jgi:hypothetical protein
MSMVFGSVAIRALKFALNSTMPPQSLNFNSICCWVLEQGFALMFGANRGSVHHTDKQIRGSTLVDP